MKKRKDQPPPLEIRICGDQLLTVEDLKDFKEDLLKAMREMLESNSPRATKKWLKSDEVKKVLNISSGTLQTLRNNGTLPFTKIGGLIYYDAEDIYKALTGKKRAFSAVNTAPKKQQAVE
jgi:hypothetical protein